MPAHDASQAFDKADALIHALDAHAELVEALPLFSYRQGHDLTGYRDGIENPTGDEAWAAAALAADGDGAGGSVGLGQRWLHFRDRMAALPAPARDHVIGRRLADDEEIAEAPESAHVKRTAQEDFDPPAFMLRRSMPWGDGRRHGLLFVAFVAALDTAQRQLERMMGLDDGLQDALLGHSQAETGTFYWCPPWDSQRLLLPAVSASVVTPAPLPAPAPCVVRVPGRTAGTQRGLDDRRHPGHQRKAVPLRPLAAQALVRRQPFRRRFCRRRRGAADRRAAGRGAARPHPCAAHRRRAAGAAWRGADRVGPGPARHPLRRPHAVPLRPLGQQALLRRSARTRAPASPHPPDMKPHAHFRSLPFGLQAAGPRQPLASAQALARRRLDPPEGAVSPFRNGRAA
ncbi:MAG: Dyp-type peroxidase [Rubrivivax sp.]|nr:Dyp-type peroxidase [Rubrivivax sp.]